MKKFAFAICATLALILPSTANNTNEEPSEYSNFVIDKMMSFYKTGIDEKLYLALDKPYFSAGEQIWCKPFLRNAITHTPLDISNFVYVELLDDKSKLVERIKIKRDSSGFEGYLSLDPKIAPGDYSLRAYTRWMMNGDDAFFFSKQIEIISPIPPQTDDDAQSDDQSPRSRRKQQAATTPQTEQAATKFDLQFMPEGGTLLAGSSQIVALKAIGEDGLSLEVEGDIYNSQEELVTQFKTSHKGMGMVTLFVNKAESYYAEVSVVGEIADRRTRVELPKVDSIGAVITATKNGDRVLFKPRASSSSILEGAHFIIHSHGRIVSVSPVRGDATCTISQSQLFEGVNIISLVDKSGAKLAERLIFKYPDQQRSFSFSSDKRSYRAREKVTLTIALDDDNDISIPQGEFAISVTDDGVVERDPLEENILSYLLLSSDIAGNVEDPALYFNKDIYFNTAERKSAEYNIDLLMRTQGWRRYSIEDILSDEIEDKRYSYEAQTEIAGGVKGFFGNDARKPKIYLLCNEPSYFDVFDLDASSKFRLVGLDMPDSTTYIVQARGRRGGNALSLSIEPDPFPSLNAKILRRDEAQKAYVPVAFVNQSQDKFFYEGGMNMINLEAVSVVTTKEEAKGISPFAAKSTTREELEMMGTLELSTLIMTYPSMTVSTDGVTYRGNTAYARFIVDDMYMEYEDISYMTTADIEQIEFLDAPAAVMYSDASGGIFVITLRKGATIGGGDSTPLNIAYVQKLGYQRPAKFYQPNYSVESLRKNLPPDYRTTIYWDASAKPNERGEIEVEFFTADKTTDYTVTVEGISDDGEIFRGTTTIERK